MAARVRAGAGAIVGARGHAPVAARPRAGVAARVIATAWACAAAVSLTIANAEPSAPADANFRVEEVAPDVYAVVQLDPLGLANHANTVFIVNRDDVVVVDAQFTLARTRAVLAALREITDKPVSVLVATHWHDDHVFGNQVYRDAFPGLEIIAHEATREDMATVGVENRSQQVAGGAGALAMFRGAVEAGTALDGTPLGDDERVAYESTIAIAGEYLAEIPDYSLTLPTTTFTDALTLHRGDRVIEIRHLGHGVSRGDAVVFLPEEGVLVAGDLVDDPLPFSYGCRTASWIGALDAILAMEPRIVVPGHGGVLHGTAGVVRLRELLVAVREQAEGAARRGETLEEARANLRIDAQRDAVVGGSKMRAFLFEQFFVGAVLADAHGEAAGN